MLHSEGHSFQSSRGRRRSPTQPGKQARGAIPTSTGRHVPLAAEDPAQVSLCRALVNKGMVGSPLEGNGRAKRLPEHCIGFRTERACFQGKVLSVYPSSPLLPPHPVNPSSSTTPPPNLFLRPWHCDEVFRIYRVGKLGEGKKRGGVQTYLE